MKQLLNPDGTPKTLGVPSLEGLGETAGVTIIRPEDTTMTNTVKEDGIYELKGGRHFIAAGDELPEGATLVNDEVLDAPVDATVNVNVADFEGFQELAADYETTLKELEAVKAELDALKAEKTADIGIEGFLEGDGSGEALPEVADYPADAKPIIAEDVEPEKRAKGKAPETKSKGAAPENRAK